jgi:predicted DNA-binding protein (MmcQ/YjbR family)
MSPGPDPRHPRPAAARTHAEVRGFALGLPGAAEEFPWEGDAVVKVNKKIFVFLGPSDGDRPPALTFKLRDPGAHEHALTFPGARPAGYGLGRSGWVTLPLDPEGAPPAELLREWVEESYRAIAPKRLVAELGRP